MSLASIKESKRSYQHNVEGTWGEFNSGGGRISYILTKARLGKGDSPSSPEVRLTSMLAPVREAISKDQLDFNQLLQRDLDDHRVATGLIPYLLARNPTGPTYLPPLLAVLLPAEVSKLNEAAYPKPDQPSYIEDDSGIRFERTEFGNSFAVEKLSGENATEPGDYSPIRLGRLHWNPEYTKLVVIDGQHRAMAMLAIKRTLETWKGNGEKYRGFYEHIVQEILDQQSLTESDLAGLEIPVNVLWFPDLVEEKGKVLLAARKLFIDVNREARTPSELNRPGIPGDPKP